MQRPVWLAVVGALVAATSALAEAADHPLVSAKLTLRRSAAGKQKLVFVSKDTGFLFPTLGSSDDPGIGSPGGALLEIASATEPGGVAFTAAAGVGKPGWQSRNAALDSHAYADPGAVPGSTALKVVVLKQSRRLKVVARGVGLALAAPQGMVGIRLTTGGLRNCALFDAPSIRRDEAGRFVAMALLPTLSDCATLLPAPPTSSTTSTSTTAPPPTTTSTTLFFSSCSGGNGFPECNGFCAAGETCQATLDFTIPGTVGCLCIPVGVTLCGQSGFPTCGGVCPGGAACQALREVQLDLNLCGCVDPTVTCSSPDGVGSCAPGVCPPGQVCLSVSQPAPMCGCGT